MPRISMGFLADSFGDNQDLCANRRPRVAANNTLLAPSIFFLSNQNKKKKKKKFLGFILQVDIWVVWVDLWCMRHVLENSHVMPGEFSMFEFCVGSVPI